MLAMDLPSGRRLNAADLELVKELQRVGFVTWSEKPYKLKSGIMSHVYVHGRSDLTTNPRVLWLLGRKILYTTNEILGGDPRQPCFIGLPAAGTSLATWAAAVDTAEGITRRNACFMLMREKKKQHGNKQDRAWVIGKPQPDLQRYILLDNAMTDGKTKQEGRRRCRRDGFPIHDMNNMVVIDREQGAHKALVRAGYRVSSLFLIRDFAYACGELKLWPKNSVRQIEREIEEHQKLMA